VNLKGYWTAIVSNGLGRIGAICSGDHVPIQPSTDADIQRVVQPRTSASAGGSPQKPLKPGKVKTDWLAVQRDREPFVSSDEFPATLQQDKMVHIVTDGGARPNQGPAGWGALISQNGRCTWNWGHWDHALNNAMELAAVVEALSVLPEQMYVWVMTDSAYVKNGITQWLPNWIANKWQNSQGNRVANKTLWEKSMEKVQRMKRVEWSWMKAHNGRLLNECADTLATKGVKNEPRSSPAQFVRVVGEDTDKEIYVLRDGEETPLVSDDDSIYPAGKTFVMKDGDHKVQ
jgi:ribonuclease HI